jgi:hypothetical protein
MDITPPDTLEGFYKQAHITLPSCGAYLTDLVYERMGNSCKIIALWAVLGPGDGGMKAADGIVASLRSRKQGEVLLPVTFDRTIFNETTRRYERITVREVQPRGLLLDPNMLDGYDFDKVRLDPRTIEIALYQKMSRVGATDHRFTLLLPYNISDEDKLALIFDHLNVRCSMIPLQPHMIPQIWDWLIRTGGAKQLPSIGRFIGFSMYLDQNQMQQFITREFEAGRMSLVSDIDEALPTDQEEVA